MGDALDPADELARLWRAGLTPDLDAFIARAGPLGTPSLAAMLRTDLRERGRAGDRVRAEDYLRRFPQVHADPDAAVDLIFAEYLLREGRGEDPHPGEYARRFPGHAGVLREQIALHRAVATPSAPSESYARSTTADAPRDVGPLPAAFGRYTLVRVLGRGGMGVVYLADDTHLGRQVALKVLRLDHADPQAVARFQREARTAAGLNHPSLCPVYDVGRADGVDFLTMPFLPGDTVAARVRRSGPLPPAEAARLVTRIAEAMQAAHDAGVVHRDLKPGNVMFGDRGEPVVTDFGLARKVSGEDARLTGSGAVLGTPAYMPPEQVGCAPEAVGPAADVYSLGAILYELLTGRPPFLGTPGEVLFQVLQDDPAPPSTVSPSAPPWLDGVCLTALAKSPADRFPSMTAFAAALGDRAGGRRAVPGRGWRTAAAVGAGAVALAGGLLLWRPWVPPAGGGGDRAAGPSAPRDPAAAAALASRGWELNDGGDLAGAVRTCDLALAQDDRCIKALACRANARLKLREYGPAIADLGRAIDLAPGDPGPLVDRAWGYNATGAYAAALADADRAIGLDPGSGEAYYHHGAARAGRREFREAADDFTAAIERGHKPHYIYRERAAAYRALGKDAAADRDEATAAGLNGRATAPGPMRP